MIRTEVVTQTHEELENRQLNLASLKTVQWVESNPVLQVVGGFSLRQYNRAKNFTLLAWIFSIIEFQLIWLWTLVHTLPWPQWLIGFIHRVDERLEMLAEAVFQKLEWWWDKTMVRLMWAAETLGQWLEPVLIYMDKIIATVLALYHWLAAIVWNIWKRVVDTRKALKQLWNESQEEDKEK